MGDVIGFSTARDQEDAFYPVSEMVSRVIAAFVNKDEHKDKPDHQDHELLQQFEEIRKHLRHPFYHGVLPVCREWVRPFGLEPSILLAHIIEQNRLHLRNGTTEEGYFELDDDQIESEFCFDKVNLRRAVEKLRVNHLIIVRMVTDKNGTRKTMCRVNTPIVKATLKALVDPICCSPEKSGEQLAGDLP